MGQASSALSSRLPKRRKLAGAFVPSAAADQQASSPDLPPRKSPEKWLSTVAAWKAELRAFRSGHAPANYLKLKFEDVCGGDACAALRAQLAALGATTPSCVYAKKLPGEQADLRHGRLSVGGKHLGRHITEALTDGELDAIIDDDRTGGLDVPVFDRDGRRYDFKCVYAEDTGFYRLTGAAEYERFMADNNVVRDVEEGKELFMELWAFRTPASGSDHPSAEGALGMVILFFDLGADGLGDELFDDASVTIKQVLRHYPEEPAEGYKLD
ncbi:hypothetical protein BAE44_0016112 [Dichanthelium oligosanthes]|uniref:Uncharacterized protein n=1 Tax=Dichanthelium oligosanthes TaxID=888268 RepID=A0A1E5VCK2_9POAL|nr:hypothetical protein BAE44_0016112 [Dichanthelium oligosanthes]